MPKDALPGRIGTLSRKREANTLWKTPRNAIGVSLWTMDVALAIVSLTNTTFELSADRLQRRRRNGTRVPANVSRATVIEHLQDIVLMASAEDICRWGDIHDAPNRRAVEEATRWVQRSYLGTMVSRQNTTERKPVTSKNLIELYNKMTIDEAIAPHGLPLVPNYLSTPSASRQWARRWRQEQGFKCGKMPCGDPVSTPDKQIKVGTCFFEKNCDSVTPFPGPQPKKRGSYFWPETHFHVSATQAFGPMFSTCQFSVFGGSWVDPKTVSRKSENFP